MAYTTQKNLKTYRATAEEWEVSRALAEYTDEPENAHTNDFVPTAILYATYREWKEQNPSDVGTLPLSHFGIALRRLFPDIKKVQRWCKGQKCCGYRCLKGPLSIRTNNVAGRPRACG